MKRFNKIFLWLPILMLLTSGEMVSQDSPEVTLETPQNTAYIHLYYLQSDSYEPQKSAMAMPPGLAIDERVSLARKLIQIYDGLGLYVYIDGIPNNPEFRDTTSNAHKYVPFPNDLPNIYMERIDSLWYYSPASVNSINTQHKSMFPLGSEIWINLLPVETEGEFLGIKTWQYFAALIILLFAVLLHLIISRFIRPIITGFAINRIKIATVDPQLIRRISRIISLLVVLYVFKFLLPSLLLPIALSEFLMKAIRIASSVFVGVLVYRLVEILIAYFQDISARTETKMDKQALPIIDKMLKFVVVLAVLMHVMSLLNINITALLAGISIGGLALALAAQDTVKNFIGSVMIFIDQPFQVGDFVQGDNFLGSIVEVGFRSTRIMLINTSIVTIPNGKVADMQITNYGIRTYRMLDSKIALTYDTPPNRIELFLEGLKKIVIDHPKLLNENYIVNFFEMADFSLKIFVRAYITVPDYATELRVKEEFYFSVMRLAAAVGVRFAFPSSTLYIEDFPEKKSRIPTYSKEPGEVKDEMMSYLEKNQELMEKLREEYDEIERQKQLEKEEDGRKNDS